MRLAVLVNDVAELVPTMTTAMLVHAAARRDHEVLVVTVDGVELVPGGVSLVGRRAPRATGADPDTAWLAALTDVAPTHVELGAAADGGWDALWIRTNPARDAGRAGLHALTLDVARLLRDQGVVVVNDPDGLARAASKTYLARLPEGLAPPTWVTARTDRVADLASELGDVVVKPPVGTRGGGVVRLAAGGDAAATHAAAGGGPVLVQPYVPAAAGGDVRLVLVDGAPLEVDGAPGAIRRVPAAGDFRANLHAGGTPAEVTLNDDVRAACAALAPMLRAHGLWLVGLDYVGADGSAPLTVIELNVFSTGGLFHARRFARERAGVGAGPDLAGAVVAALERRVRA